jgi:hypothetical protein|tara:strand:+ start:618 stop:809 length:192 start_codon:yes stop_codon:yes gene_type:complete
MNNTLKEISGTAIVNGSVLSVTTFSNLELGLKIILLIITILYTLDKWYFNKKNRDKNEEKKIK